MKKETLLLSNITNDLKAVVDSQIMNIVKWRFTYIVPVTLLSIIYGALLKNIWISLLIFSVAAYHIVRYIIEYRNFIVKKKTVKSVVDRTDVCITIEKLSHFATDQVYEPHFFDGRGRAAKTVRYYYFESGCRWRVPDVDKHYRRSKDYYISSKGLENTSIQGDEFYFISLQGYQDIAYIYPCKNFELDKSLEK